MVFIRNSEGKVPSQRNRGFVPRPSQRSHRLPLSVFAFFLHFCILCLMLQPSTSHLSLRSLEESIQNSSNDTSADIEVRCFESNDCTRCPPTGNRESCEATDRRQRFHCHVNTDEGGSQSYTEYRSCSRTSQDEKNFMYRFQVICFITGVISVASIRKQKSSTASLFDQRKRRMASKDTISRGKYSKVPVNDTNTRNSSFDDSVMEKAEMLTGPSSEAL